MVTETDTRSSDRRDKHDAARAKTPPAEARKSDKKESPLDYLPTSDSVHPDVDASDVIY